ncbi:MAG: acyl-CoA dehydrogenase family protein [Roseiflexaceae bacterium]
MKMVDVEAILAPLVAEIATQAAIHDQAGTFPHQSYRCLHEAGYLRLVLPVEYGGAGANLLAMVHGQELLGRADGAVAMATGMLVQLIGRLAEDRPWPEAVFAEVCTALARDGGLINSVVTEPDLGSISRGGTPATHALPVEGGWLVNGHKIFATGAPVLRFHVTGLTLPPSADAPQGWQANAIIPANAPGVRSEPTWSENLSMRTCGNDDIFYEQVFVPDAWMVDRKRIGAPTSPSKRPEMNAWSLVIAAGYLGVGQAALDAACDYANTRIPPSLGKPIGELPHIQQWIGRMAIALGAARSVLHEAARRWDQEPAQRADLAAQIAMAKYLCTNAACEASETAMRVAGGFSLTRRLPLERYYRDARAGLFHPPQDDLAIGVIARSALAARQPK